MAETTSADAPPDAPVRAGSKWIFALFVALCCVVSLYARWKANLPRTAVNHGDIAFYYTVAKNLVEGRGFTLDYIWTYWSHPEGLPTPSNLWWMPLPSLIGAVGMWIGEVDYVSAQAATIVFASILPWPVYLLGRDLWNCRRVGLVGAALSTTFHLFMDQPAALLSHCPYVVFATLTLWLALRLVRAGNMGSWAFAFGVSLAFTQLSRSDGILLVGSLGAAFLFARRRPTLQVAAMLVLGYALIMSPWWARNAQDFGAMMPGGSFRAMFMTEYESWYALPESVTPDAYFAEGWERIAQTKWNTARSTFKSLSQGMVEGSASKQLARESVAVVGLMWLSWFGLLGTFKRRFGFLWAHALFEFGFYTVLFTSVATESFRSGMYSLYPFLVICAGRGIQTLAHVVTTPLAKREALRQRVAWSLIAATVLAFAYGQYDFSVRNLVRKSAGIDRLNAFHEMLDRRVLTPLGLDDEILMTREVHELWAISEQPCIQIPFEPEPVIREVAERFGATHLLFIGEHALELRPGLKWIDQMPGYDKVFGPARLLGQEVTLYALVDV